jgi:hypothetical protein
LVEGGVLNRWLVAIDLPDVAQAFDKDNEQSISDLLQQVRVLAQARGH